MQLSNFVKSIDEQVVLPDIILEAGWGQLGVLLPVEDHQRLLLVARHLVVHHQPIQLNHKVYLNTMDFIFCIFFRCESTSTDYFVRRQSVKQWARCTPIAPQKTCSVKRIKKWKGITFRGRHLKNTMQSFSEDKDKELIGEWRLNMFLVFLSSICFDCKW